MDKNTKFNLKIFQIDKSYYEFKDKSPQEIIDIIKANHIRRLHNDYDDVTGLTPKVTHFLDGEFECWSYSFNQPKDKNYWTIFLPEDLTYGHNFKITEFSFVLFIKYNLQIYCVISGSGINVIKKFIQPSYGLDIYQKIASPEDDVILNLQTRGVANNISQKSQIYNFEQSLSEELNYSEVPIKLKVKIRNELKKGLFRKYNNDDNLNILEVGSYFFLRTKLDYYDLKQLIMDLNEITEKRESKQLSLFYRISDSELVYKLDKELKSKIIDDILSHGSPSFTKNSIEIIEIVHPSKLERFYECDSYLIRFKNSRKSDDRIIMERSNLYYECTKLIYNDLNAIDDRFTAEQRLLTTNIRGLMGKREVTYATFYSHVTAELDYGNKYFRIDNHWYLLEDRFLKLMNDDAISYYSKYRLEDKVLLPWNKNDDEDSYNLSHSNLTSHIVMDKLIFDNIELCDILVFNEDKVYFIHVKNDFNTKLRELYIQIILSAKRLSNDLKNHSGSNYLRNSILKYINTKQDQNLEIDKIMNRITKSKITFVMAYKSNLKKGSNAIERIELSKSNIAKYSIVQVVKEMQQFNFDIRLIDISEIDSLTTD